MYQIWSIRRESNPRNAVLQTARQPLPRMHMAVATGLEPIPTESKSVVLPLHYATVVGIKGVGPLSYAYKAHALTVELDPIVRTKKVPGFPRPYLHHAQCCSASYAGACRRVPVRRQEHIALGAGTPGRTRTFNLPVNSRLLYRLSYRGIRNKKARGLFSTGRPTILKNSKTFLSRT